MMKGNIEEHIISAIPNPFFIGYFNNTMTYFLDSCILKY